MGRACVYFRVREGAGRQACACEPALDEGMHACVRACAMPQAGRPM